MKGITESLIRNYSVIHQGMGKTRKVFTLRYNGTMIKASNENNFLRNYLNVAREKAEGRSFPTKMHLKMYHSKDVHTQKKCVLS